jgi:poly(A) polymerase
LLAEDADPRPALFCEEFLARTPPDELNPPPLITGDDLVELGMSPGPKFKKLLDQVRTAQLDGEILDRAEAIELAKRLLEESSP